MLCECNNQARTGQLLLTSHHPNCPKYDVTGDAYNVIESLLKGIDSWATDEDGVHPDAWAPYCKARAFIGLSIPKDSRP